MKDRVPKYPNRRKITYEDGRVEYVTIEYADEPTQVGTLIGKATLLDDATAALMSLGEDATPSSMFAAIANMLLSTKSTAESAELTASAAATLLAGARVGVQTYVGTGGSGGSNSNSLTWDFKPFFMIIHPVGDRSQIAFFYPQTLYDPDGDYSNDSGYAINELIPSAAKQRAYISDDGKTVSWHVADTSSSANAKIQMNTKGTTYAAVAVGGNWE